jgi:hypothetical protein
MLSPHHDAMKRMEWLQEFFLAKHPRQAMMALY